MFTDAHVKGGQPSIRKFLLIYHIHVCAHIYVHGNWAIPCAKMSSGSASGFNFC